MNLKHFVKNSVGMAMLAGALLLAPQAANAGVFVSVGIAPPVIPVYSQPLCPGDGYIWTPGYWAYGDEGYYWVEGAWVLAPYVGALWTPGYWGYGGGGYFWNAGYWGRRIGYYGGINYGFGYFGTGFYGGYWNGGRFWYNRGYGHFGEGFRGNFYNHPVAGVGFHGGTTSFARGGNYISNNRGSNIGGRDGFRGGSSNYGNRNGFTGNTNRGGFGNGGSNNSGVTTHYGSAPAQSHVYNGASQPRSSYQGNNAGGGYRGGNPGASNAGGGFRGGGNPGGGGGGFHGGGNPGGGGGAHVSGGGGGGSHGGGGGGHR